MSSSPPIILPICTIQHDFQAVLADVRDGVVADEDVWVSCYRAGAPSVHGKVRVRRGGGERGGEVGMESRLGVEFERGQKGMFSVSCAGLSIPPTTIRVPRQVFRSPEHSDKLHPQQINALDISPDGLQIATGYNDGSIARQLVSSSSSSPASDAVIYKPHVAALTSLRFFPSSRVGKALLNQCAALADEAGVPIAVEASKAATPVYASVGFKTVRESEMAYKEKVVKWPVLVRDGARETVVKAATTA